MCHWRKVTNTYLRCGHTLRLPDERILCGNARCKFSDRHDPNCPACIDTCFQYGDRPKSYNPQIDWYCPKCAAYMTAGH